MAPRNDHNDIAAIIQSAVSPLMIEMQSLKVKVDTLSVDRVTRMDIEKLRGEIIASFVPRDAYEPRHASLVDRDIQLESALRDLRKEYDNDMQRLHDRLESGKQQLEERMKQQQIEVNKQLDKQQDAKLSGEDRLWMRATQIVSGAAVVLALLDFVLQHLHFS